MRRISIRLVIVFVIMMMITNIIFKITIIIMISISIMMITITIVILIFQFIVGLTCGIARTNCIADSQGIICCGHGNIMTFTQGNGYENHPCLGFSTAVHSSAFRIPFCTQYLMELPDGTPYTSLL